MTQVEIAAASLLTQISGILSTGKSALWRSVRLRRLIDRFRINIVSTGKECFAESLAKVDTRGVVSEITLGRNVINGREAIEGSGKAAIGLS